MTQREEFEAWFHKYDDNNFMTAEDSELMFEAWQAAKAQAVPEGWKLVPMDPTKEMFDAAFDAPCIGHPETSGQSYDSIYKAMLAAAPEQNK